MLVVDRAVAHGLRQTGVLDYYLRDNTLFEWESAVFSKQHHTTFLL